MNRKEKTQVDKILVLKSIKMCRVVDVRGAEQPPQAWNNMASSDTELQHGRRAS